MSRVKLFIQGERIIVFVKKDLTEIVNWYQQRYYYIKLSEKTRETVDDILKKITSKLQELEEKDEQINKD